MDYQKIKNELYEKQDGKCFYCGELLTPNNMQLDHFYPKSLGRINSINNLVLTCSKCNSQKSNHSPFLEIEFVNFIAKILEKRKDFRNLKKESLISQELRYKADIFVEQKINNKWVPVLIEIKTTPTFTSNRLFKIINQLNSYKKALPKNTKIIFVFPGRLSENDYKIVRENEIEVWDKDTIGKEFEKEIKSINNKLFFSYFSNTSIQPRFENELITKLNSIIAGKKEWSKYQKHIGTILDYLFKEILSEPITELPDKNLTNRRDFILRNYAEKGFWKYLRSVYQADFIVIDAKNYVGKIKKNQILQISNYLKQHGTGLFAIIISRNGEENKSSYLTRKEKWILERKMIIILSDEDVINMIIAKNTLNSPDEIIKQKIENFRLEM